MGIVLFCLFFGIGLFVLAFISLILAFSDVFYDIVDNSFFFILSFALAACALISLIAFAVEYSAL